MRGRKQDRELSSRRLVALLRAKNPEGFCALRAKYGRLVRWYFRDRGMTEAEADEHCELLIEDIAMSKIRFFRGHGRGFPAWFRKLMKRAAVNWWRERRGRETEPLPDQIEAAQESLDEEGGQLAESAKGIAGEAVEHLGPVDRRILESRVFGGMSYAEIGAEWKIRAGTAKVRYHRIKQVLQCTLMEGEVRRLREAREQTVFVPQGFCEYVRDLAKASGRGVRSGSAVMRWFGIAGKTLAADGRRVARLARRMGMSHGELMVRIGIEAARGMGEPITEIPRGNEPAAVASLESYQARLAGIHWDAKTEAALKKFERAAAAEYEEGNH